MSLFITKVLALLAYPLGLGLALGLSALGLGVQRRWPRLRRASPWLGGLGLGLVWLSSLPVVAHALYASLEWRIPTPTLEQLPEAQAIVVLGGGTAGLHPPRQAVELNAAGDRVLHAARLYRADKAPWVLVTGGKPPGAEGQAEADGMRVLLEEWGVPTTAILLEAGSATTYENARNSVPLLQAHAVRRILLVTSAAHLPRATAVFAAQGFEVYPAPTDYRAVRRDDRSLLDWLPDAEALTGTTAAWKEYLALVYYRLRGWA